MLILGPRRTDLAILRSSSNTCIHKVWNDLVSFFRSAPFEKLYTTKLNLLQSLCQLFSSLCEYTHLLVCGDFNFREIVWSDLSGSSNNSHIEPFLDSVDDLFLFQHVCNPTRFRQAVSLSLLHLVFTSEKDMVANPSYLLPLGNSDHICLQFSVLCYSEYDVSNNIRYNIGAANIDMMKEALGNIDYESI